MPTEVSDVVYVKAPEGGVVDNVPEGALIVGVIWLMDGAGLGGQFLMPQDAVSIRMLADALEAQAGKFREQLSTPAGGVS